MVVLTFALPLQSSASTGNGKLAITFLFHPGHLVVVGLLVVVVLLVVLVLGEVLRGLGEVFGRKKH